MADVNILRVIFGLLLVLFLPGWTMINLMFPRKGELDEEFDNLYRVTLGMAMSIAVVILVGFVLGNPGLGYAPTPDPDLDDDGVYNDEDKDVDNDGVPNEMAELFSLSNLSLEPDLKTGSLAPNVTAAFAAEGFKLPAKAKVEQTSSKQWKLNGWTYYYEVVNETGKLVVSGEDRDDDGDGVVDAEDDSPQGETKGWFQFRYIVTALLSITAIFFTAGWWRGAYPRLGRVHPKLARAPPGVKVAAERLVEGTDIPENIIRMHGLKKERSKVKEKLKLVEKKTKATAGSMRAYYQRQEKVLLEDLADIDRQLGELESRGQAGPIPAEGGVGLTEREGLGRGTEPPPTQSEEAAEDSSTELEDEAEEQADDGTKEKVGDEAEAEGEESPRD